MRKYTLFWFPQSKNLKEKYFYTVVGYTPFYAEEPVVTCRKILRWAHFLEVPDRIVSAVSSDCIDFLLGLITDSNKRYGILFR